MLTMEMHKSDRVQRRYSLQKPILDCLFCVLALFSSIDLVQKSAVKKTRHQTDNICPDREAGGPCFRTPKTPVSPQVAQKTGSATKSQILLTTRLMSTSGALTHLHSLEIAPSAQWSNCRAKYGFRIRCIGSFRCPIEILKTGRTNGKFHSKWLIAPEGGFLGRVPRS